MSSNGCFSTSAEALKTYINWLNGLYQKINDPLARARTEAPIFKGYDPLLPSHVKNYIEILEELHEAVSNCHQCFDMDSVIIPSAMSHARGAMSVAANNAERWIDDAIIKLISYKPHCQSIQERYLHQRREVREKIEYALKLTQIMVDNREEQLAQARAQQAQRDQDPTQRSKQRQVGIRMLTDEEMDEQELDQGEVGEEEGGTDTCQI